MNDKRETHLISFSGCAVLPEGKKTIQPADAGGRIILRSETEELSSQNQSKIQLGLPGLSAGMLVATLLVDGTPVVTGQVVLSK